MATGAQCYEVGGVERIKTALQEYLKGGLVVDEFAFFRYAAGQALLT